jgi:hypothetical protein
MTKKDRVLLVTGLILFLISCLYLPMEMTWGDQSAWLQTGWYWITRLGAFSSTQYRVDFSRLVLEWLAIGAVLAVARLTLLASKKP